MFQINKKILVFSGLVLAILVVITANQLFKSPDTVPGDSTPSLDITTVSENNGGTNIEKPYSGPANPQASSYFGRPLAEVRLGAGFSAPEAVTAEKRGDLKVLATVLSANPKGSGGVDDWIAVGVIKKFFNDYEGARDAWEYAGVLYPGNALSFANLGNLYGFYLHDNTKAESNLKKAIANDPYQTAYYIGLADFYKNVYTAKKSEAIKVLLDGMSIIKDVNLVLALATYYRDEGDKTNALKYYEEVIKMSPGQAGIEEEISRLK